MTKISQRIAAAKSDDVSSVIDITRSIAAILNDAGYTIVEINDTKPWGAYIRIANSEADRFLEDFFDGLSPTEARLGNNDAELSPKILIVSPGQRLSWQYHERRAERWTFLTSGKYMKSSTDTESDVYTANKGEVVQFSTSERHRLIGNNDTFVLVAEIWQHTDKSQLSNEDDVIRLSDDYIR